MTKKHNTLGGKIQRCRKGLGISQEELAQRLGVSRQSVAKWETGQSVPDLNRLVTLADILGASLDYLLRDTIPQDAAAAPESPAARQSAPPVTAYAGEGGMSPDAVCETGDLEERALAVRETCCPPCALQEEKESQPVPEPRASGLETDDGEKGGHGGGGASWIVRPEAIGPGNPSASQAVSGRMLADCSREPFGFSTRRLVAACGMALVTVGIVGLATLWVLSEMHPVQLTMWDGSLREGVWGFVLAHNLDKVFFATCGTALGGIILLSGVWISSRRKRR
ncbi:MAG TPA: helix-turn-helix transcriptional regulator [Candidatus Avidesulfovibrio excrementigallinarum]|nr:helix-turn-helix transcriptional regulator [Candidatus Avidesulfovibrio excrementigallinarum]